MIIKADCDGLCMYCTGLSESFEVDGWVVKVSGQSRDILFKKHHPQRNAKQTTLTACLIPLTLTLVVPFRALEILFTGLQL